MKRFTVLAIALVFSLCFVGATWAHVPEAVTYYVFQWPDEYIPDIDGDLSDWDIVPDVYQLTHENFSEDVKGLGVAYDASDLDLRCYAGWNKTTNRMYFSTRWFDDIAHVKEYWEVTIDADHSGENQMAWFSDLSDEEAKRLGGAYGQTYKTYLIQANEGRGWIWSFTTAKWILEPEWFEWARVLDAPIGGEGVYQQELSAHAWDDLDYHGPEVSDIHIFEEGQIIGMCYQIADYDESDSYDGYWTLGGGAAAPQFEYALTDFLLAPIDEAVVWPEGPTTSVGVSSWGLIKSSFSK